MNSDLKDTLSKFSLNDKFEEFAKDYDVNYRFWGSLKSGLSVDMNKNLGNYWVGKLPVFAGELLTKTKSADDIKNIEVILQSNKSYFEKLKWIREKLGQNFHSIPLSSAQPSFIPFTEEMLQLGLEALNLECARKGSLNSGLIEKDP